MKITFYIFTNIFLIFLNPLWGRWTLFHRPQHILLNVTMGLFARALNCVQITTNCSLFFHFQWRILLGLQKI